MSRVVICCANAEFQAAYVRRAARHVGATSIIIVPDCQDILSTVEATDLLIFDLECLHHAGETDVATLAELVRRAKTSVLLNVPSTAAETLGEASRVCSSYLPESEIDRYLIEFAATDMPTSVGKREAQRIASQVTREGSGIAVDSVSQGFLAELTSRIDQDPSKLADCFVTKAADHVLPGSNALEFPGSSIEDAVMRIRAFLGGTKGQGRFIVGEKGAGKSTLTRYAAMLAEQEHSDLLVLGIDYQWVAFFEAESLLPDLIDEYARVASTDPGMGEGLEKLRHELRTVIEGEGWTQFQSVSIRVAASLERLLRDTGYCVRIYKHFEQPAFEIADLIDDYTDRRTTASSAAAGWSSQVRSDPRRALALVLLFEMGRTQERFLAFSWERLFASIEAAAAQRPDLESSVRAHIEADDATKATLAARAHQSGDVHRFGRALLKDLARTLHIVVLFDNVDQRSSALLENQLLRHVSTLAADLTRSAGTSSIVAMRPRTFASYEFARVDLLDSLGWSAIQVLPPDLGDVLTRRIERLVRSGFGVGTSSFWLVQLIRRLVADIVAGRHTLLQLIESRHPFNIRAQLGLVAALVESTHLHRIIGRAGRELSRLPDLSFEQCIRMLVTGPRTVYREVEQTFVPNMYDNGFRMSPYNAVIRPMLLAKMSHWHSFQAEALVETFVNAGVPKDEVLGALQNAEMFDLVRSTYGRSGEFAVTPWGRFFWTNLMFRLPYIQAIWWDVALPSGFSFGSPKYLRWDELHACTREFERWIWLEESVAMQSLRVNPVADCVGSISQLISEQFVHDLYRIEQSVTRTR